MLRMDTTMHSQPRRRSHALLRVAVIPGLLVLCLAVACDDADAVAVEDAAIGQEPDARPLPEAAARSFRVGIDVPDVPPGTEGTKCVKIRLGNVDAIKVGRVHNQLSGQSHHFIVSSVTDAMESEEPFRCPPSRTSHRRDAHRHAEEDER